MKRLLWLDDIRDPKGSIWWNWLARNEINPTQYEITWVKSYEEFKDWIVNNGLPDVICFDHDLSREHTKYFFNNGGHDNPPNPMDTEFEEKTGYDCAKWLVDYCVDNGMSLPSYKIQSANPVGAKNIRDYLKNAEKHLNL